MPNARTRCGQRLGHTSHQGRAQSSLQPSGHGRRVVVEGPEHRWRLTIRLLDDLFRLRVRVEAQNIPSQHQPLQIERTVRGWHRHHARTVRAPSNSNSASVKPTQTRETVSVVLQLRPALGHRGDHLRKVTRERGRNWATSSVICPRRESAAVELANLDCRPVHLHMASRSHCVPVVLGTVWLKTSRAVTLGHRGTSG